MAYNKAPADHTEFGGGPGLIDPQRRKDRVLEGHEELWEIYATDPSDPQSDPATVSLEDRTPRADKWDASVRRGTT